MISLQDARRITNKEPMFFCQKRNDLLLFSYRYCDPTVYEKYPESRELRGIIFNESGEIIARPFPKFFNFGEKCCPVRDSDIATTVDKLDGSLVIAFNYNDHIRFASKGSLNSWVTERAKEIITMEQQRLVEDMKGKTVMFELIDPNNPIVIRYNKPQLVLIGIRDNRTGNILPPEDLVALAVEYNIPCTTIIHKHQPVSVIRKDISYKKDKEGIVGYSDADMFKLKTEWYIKIHKALFQATEERIARLFFSGELDDIYGFLSDTQKSYVDDTISHITDILNRCVNQLEEFIEENKDCDRKTYAIKVINQVPKVLRPAYFNAYDGVSPRDAIVNVMKRHAKRERLFRLFIDSLEE